MYPDLDPVVAIELDLFEIEKTIDRLRAANLSPEHIEAIRELAAELQSIDRNETVN